MKPVVKQKLSTLQDIINTSLNLSKTLPLTLTNSNALSFPVYKLLPGKYLLILFFKKSTVSLFDLTFVEWTGNPTTSNLSFLGTTIASGSFNVVDNKNVIYYNSYSTFSEAKHAYVINLKNA